MKIQNDYIAGEVLQIRPRIFAVVVKDDYQRTMLFCRYIEFCESPYTEIRNKFFTWEKFMSVYRMSSKQKLFTYPEDWDGFGITSDMLEKGINVFSKDKGPYDTIMSDIYSYCQNEINTPKTNWYLIGTDDHTASTIEHEIAHGLYDTNNDYKRNCDILIKKMNPTDYETFRKKIVDMGYNDDKKTIDDEIQAWMSTGLSNGLDTEELSKYQPEFVKNFKKYNTTPISERKMILKHLLPKTT